MSVSDFFNGQSEKILAELREDRLACITSNQYNASSPNISDIIPIIFRAASGRVIDVLLNPDMITDYLGEKWDPWFNSFPAIKPCRETFPVFVGVCGNKPLKAVLSAILEQCQRMSQRFNRNEVKTVLLLTTKWDSLLFRNDYEKAFLHYAAYENVIFTFMLATDYGLSEIPFLPWDEEKLGRVLEEYRRAASQEEEALEALFRRDYLEYRTMTYEVMGISTEIYEFDLMRWTYRHIMQRNDREHEIGKTRKLPYNAVLEFAASVRDLLALPEREYRDDWKSRADQWHEAELFGKSFTWYKKEGLYEQIEDAFEHLITASK